MTITPAERAAIRKIAEKTHHLSFTDNIHDKLVRLLDALEIAESRAAKAEAERDVLARRCMEDNTSFDYGHEFPSGFETPFDADEPTEDEAVQRWLEWAAQEARQASDSAKSEREGEAK